MIVICSQSKLCDINCIHKIMHIRNESCSNPCRGFGYASVCESIEEKREEIDNESIYLQEKE